MRLDGTLHVAGNDRQFAFAPALDLSAPGLPRGRLGGRVTLDAGMIELQPLLLEVGGGSFTAAGQVPRDEAVEGAVAVVAQAFDPALLAPAWSGRLDGAIAFRGSGLGAGTPTGTLQVQTLQGQLRQRAVNADGAMALCRRRAWRGDPARAQRARAPRARRRCGRRDRLQPATGRARPRGPVPGLARRADDRRGPGARPGGLAATRAHRRQRHRRGRLPGRHAARRARGRSRSRAVRSNSNSSPRDWKWPARPSTARACRCRARSPSIGSRSNWRATPPA